MQAEIQEKPTEGGMARRGVGKFTLIFLLITALMSGIGFGVITPVLPFIVQDYVSPTDLALTIGWLTAIYSVCQMFAAPVLGALSDVLGRRLLLLFCLVGSAIGYVIFGIGGALWILFVSRIIDGITGGNFSILSAYIADVTAPEKRGKFFGMFGAMVGIGFIVGPVLGGFSAKISLSAPLYIAAGITLLNVLLGLFVMPESMAKDQSKRAKIDVSTFNPFQHFLKIFSFRELRWLFVANFCYALPFTVMMTLSSVLSIDSLGWTPEMIGYMMLSIGVMDILMQGVLSAWLLKRFSETTLSCAGFFCAALSFISMGSIVYIHSIIPMILMVFFWGLASGLLEPALRGLISRMTKPEDQGVVAGGTQSIQSLTTIIGPIVAGMIYSQWGHALPFWIGAGIFLLGIIAISMAIPVVRKFTLAQKEQADEEVLLQTH